MYITQHCGTTWGNLSFSDNFINFLKYIQTDISVVLDFKDKKSSLFHVRSECDRILLSRHCCSFLNFRLGRGPRKLFGGHGWVMRRVNELDNRRIVWRLTARLGGLSFADGIAVLAHSSDENQAKT